MTSRLVEEDPELALEHARGARALAARVGYVREAVGLAAYRAGEYAEALSELRAARRLLNTGDHIPVMADCERGLGRPEKALALAKDPAVKQLDKASKIELMIVVSGARRDLGQPDAAVVSLQGSALDSLTVQPWTLSLWYAYAAALEEAARYEDALQWFGSAASIDVSEETDAHERVWALEERLGIDSPDDEQLDLATLDGRLPASSEPVRDEAAEVEPLQPVGTVQSVVETSKPVETVQLVGTVQTAQAPQGGAAPTPIGESVQVRSPLANPFDVDDSLLLGAVDDDEAPRAVPVVTFTTPGT